jgi:hypothetical protein
VYAHVTKQICVVFQKFVEKLQTMAVAEGSTQIPLNPPFSKGNFFRRTLTPLWKRAEGEIFGGTAWELCSEFLGQDIRLESQKCGNGQ